MSEDGDLSDQPLIPSPEDRDADIYHDKLMRQKIQDAVRTDPAASESLTFLLLDPAANARNRDIGSMILKLGNSR